MMNATDEADSHWVIRQLALTLGHDGSCRRLPDARFPPDLFRADDGAFTVCIFLRFIYPARGCQSFAPLGWEQLVTQAVYQINVRRIERWFRTVIRDASRFHYYGLGEGWHPKGRVMNLFWLSSRAFSTIGTLIGLCIGVPPFMSHLQFMASIQ